jgi:hypothetical protein
MSIGHDVKSGVCLGAEPAARPEDDDHTDRRLAVRPNRAWRMLDCGPTYGYGLLAAGELESFTLGRSRRITVPSIKALIARRLAASVSGELRRDLVEPAVHGRKQRRSQRDASTRGAR